LGTDRVKRMDKISDMGVVGYFVILEEELDRMIIGKREAAV
jgi:hypothetical protein